jgi:hypothetical protein
VDAEGNEIGKKREAGMRCEKFPAHRKKFGMQNSFDAGQVDFRVFGVGMISLHQNRACRQQQQDAERLIFRVRNWARPISLTDFFGNVR